MRKLLCISYWKNKTNDWVQGKIYFLVVPQATVKRRKLVWLRQVTRHDSLPKAIHQGTVEVR